LRPFNRKNNFSGGGKKVALMDKIVELASDMPITQKDAIEKDTKRVVEHVVFEFSKKGIGGDYTGYHDITHELEVTYFTLLAAKFHFEQKEFNQNDVTTLFLSALLHDFDPLKESEKPHNDNVESFIRNDKELAKLIVPFETDLNIVLALIRRTTYPFNGKQKEHALERMQELFSLAGIHKDDTVTRNHYEQLGWFLSICDRIAGYSLGDFKYARELARRNAISMAWPPSVINEQVVKYFKSLKVEKKMLDYVLMGVSDDYRKNLFNNIAGFRRARENEVRSKAI
jgi:HD domain